MTVSYQDTAFQKNAFQGVSQALIAFQKNAFWTGAFQSNYFNRDSYKRYGDVVIVQNVMIRRDDSPRYRHTR